ncbi:MAG: CAP domain-containing protein [Microthrixaceae bacterium]
MRTVRRLALPMALLLALGFVASACTRNAAAAESAKYVNEVRSTRGIGPLRWDPTLINKAQAWAEVMAARGAASHSVLADGAGDNWRILGENVGMAGSVAEMHNLFMNSAPHRSNILNGAYNRIGTGVAESGGRYFVVQVFAG